MHTKKLFSKMVPWLVIFATVFITTFGANVTPVAAVPAALPNVGTVTVDAQVGTLDAGTPGSVTYLVTVTSASDAAFDATLSIPAGTLPAGTSASFSPNPLTFPGGTGTAGTALTSVLTISTDGTETAGVTAFSVEAFSPGPPGTSNIDVASGNGTLTIKTGQTITFGALPDKTAGDPDFTVSATADSSLPVTFAATGDCTVTGNLVHLTFNPGSALFPGGTCTITASQAGDATYNPAADVAQTFAIKSNQTITFSPLPDATFGAPDFTVVATADSGLIVTFTAANDCTVTGDLVHLTGAGTCTITAAQAGDTYYNPATDVAQTFAITKGAQSITFDPLPDKTFADLDFTVVATATSSLPVSFAAAGDCTVLGGLVHLTPPSGGSSVFPIGSCTITASQAGDVNYSSALDVAQTFAISQGIQTITFDPLPDKAFGDLDFTVVATATSGLTVTFTAADSCSVTGDLVHLTGIGSCTIGASQAGDAIYGPAVVSQTFAINPAQTDMAVTKSVDNATPFDGDTVVFTINVANNGPQNTAAITVTDLLPAGLTFVGDDGAGAYNNTTGEWLIGTMGAGISATLKITATVDLNTDGDIITNTTTVASSAADTDLLNNTANTVITVRVNDVCATTGTITMPDGVLPIWGYAPGDCTRGIPAQLPGPTIFATVGETINLTLHNNLSEATAILFKGQEMIPDLTGAAPLGSQSYSFIANNPGTYLYEAGLLAYAQHQIPMGLYGALIVRPVNAGQAYNDPATAFDDEAVLVLSDIDPALNNSPNPATFDIRQYEPTYFMINGKVYPNTDTIPTAAGNQVLIRYINAGLNPYTMAMLGVNPTAIAMDGSPYTYGRTALAEMLAPGQTADMLVSIPVDALNGTKYALYNSNLLLHNNTTSVGGFGGMLTFLTATGNLSAGDIVGPEISALSATATTVDATVSDVGRGDSNIAAAEFFIDATGATGTGTAMTLSGTLGTLPLGSPTLNVSGVIAPPLAGGHTVYVHGQDALGNWGPFRSITLVGDAVGPATLALSLSHTPNNGTMDAVLRGTADDRDSGNSTIIAAQYTIDGGAAVGMSVNPAGAKVAGLSHTIPASALSPLNDGVHAIAVQSQDAQGNWGGLTTFNLTIDKNGPSTTNVVVSPNPNNGRKPINASIFAVRVRADFTDSSSDIAAAEGFIDTVYPDGQGFVIMPTDGVFNTSTESGYSDLPLGTISLLSQGNHTIYVHSKDSAGNWGTFSTAVLFVDSAPPTITPASVTPNPTGGAATVLLSATASDTAGAITAAEWFVGADPGMGNATPMAISGTGPYNLAATIDVSTWVNNDYALFVRAMDVAGNWSTPNFVILTVNTPPPPVITPTLNFSTLGSTPVPGVGGTADNADIYNWDGTAYSHQVSAAAVGVPGFPNVDGLVFNSPSDFYISLTGNWNIPGVGIAQDEDIIHFSGGVWSIFIDLTPQGMTRAAQDIDAFDIVGGVLYFSTRGNRNPPGVGGTPDNADIYSWDGTTFARVFDATANGLPANTNVDGLKFIDATHFYLSFSRGRTRVTGMAGRVNDEDVIYYNAGNWSMYFDGTTHGLGGDGRLDIDAIDLP